MSGGGCDSKQLNKCEELQSIESRLHRKVIENRSLLIWLWKRSFL